MLFKKKDILFSFFIGLNSTLIMHGVFYPFIIWVSSKLKEKDIKISNALIVISFFMFGTIIASSNLIYTQLFAPSSHRIFFKAMPISALLHLQLKSFVPKIIFFSDLYHGFVTPFFMSIPFIIAGLISGEKILRKAAIYLFLLMLLAFSLRLFLPLYSNVLGPLKSIQFDRFGYFFCFLFLFYGNSFFELPSSRHSKKIILFVAVCYLCFSLYSHTGINLSNTFTKSEKNTIYEKIHHMDFIELFSIFNFKVFHNEKAIIATSIQGFDSYYRTDEYKCIKKTLDSGRVLSIGIDPTIAVYNGIPSIDGYHNFYPAWYKRQFREIIAQQLVVSHLIDYYDDWGSRVYSFVDKPQEMQIDFSAAKKIGASYVISDFELTDISLERIYPACTLEKIHVYKIL